jgi:hypothetical protein
MYVCFTYRLFKPDFTIYTYYNLKQQITPKVLDD